MLEDKKEKEEEEKIIAEIKRKYMDYFVYTATMKEQQVIFPIGSKKRFEDCVFLDYLNGSGRYLVIFWYDIDLGNENGRTTKLLSIDYNTLFKKKVLPYDYRMIPEF